MINEDRGDSLSNKYQDRLNDNTVAFHGGGAYDDEIREAADKQAKGVRTKKYIIIGSIIAAVALFIIVLAVTLSGKEDPSAPPSPSPGPSINNPYQSNKDPELSYSKYTAFVGRNESIDNNLGIKETKNNFYVDNLVLEASMLDYFSTRLVMVPGKDSNDVSTRYLVPPEFKSPQHNKFDGALNVRQAGIFFSTDPTKPFYFSLKNETNGETLITTEDESFLYMNQYIQVSFKLQTPMIFGLGERVTDLTLKEGVWDMWASVGDYVFDDGTGGKNLHGHHPVLVNQLKNGNFIGIYLYNSNGQRVRIRKLPKPFGDFDMAVDFITIGGVPEFYFFTGPTYELVIQEYHNLVGRPKLTPSYSAGLHVGLDEDMATVRELVGNFTAAEIPLEGVQFSAKSLKGSSNF